jgi:hypothetical protein
MFSVSTGSVIGEGHARAGRNNQDGVAVSGNNDLIVVAITDGCSSAKSSEVGALMGARWLAEWVPAFMTFAPDDAGLLESVRKGLLEFIYQTARSLHPHSGELALAVEEFFLFGFLVAVVDAERVRIFGLGDGVFSVNGKVTVLDPGPTNAPPYLSYELVRDSVVGDPGPLDLVLHYSGPTRELNSLVIGTDGLIDLIERAEEHLADGKVVGDLKQFELDPLLLKDSSRMQRRLEELGTLNHVLDDDTTLALIRKMP